MRPNTAADQAMRAAFPWSRGLRMMTSVGIGLHLLAIYAAPWSSPPPASDLARLTASFFMPYLKATAQDNGYRFFAPDPGPSHLIQYELVSSQGAVVNGEIPDRGTHWPRLLYHRHFMIAEMLYSLTYRAIDPPTDPPIPPEVQEALNAERVLAALLAKGVARNLLATHPEAAQVRLFMQTHLLPSPEDLRRGIGLRDPAGFPPPYPLGEYARESL